MKKRNESRRKFIKTSTAGLTAFSLGNILSTSACTSSRKRGRVIDGMMHLEVVGEYWPELPDEVIEHYDYNEIDKGVILATWMPSRESNDWTFAAYKKYPDRFIPFGHVRLFDTDWESELKRVSEPPWKGLKLHQSELRSDFGDIKTGARIVIEKAAEFGIKLVKIHYVDYEAIEELTREIPEVTWILPHMGCYGRWRDMQLYCELARNRSNVYLDTCAVAAYYMMGEGIEWAGAENVTWASDGFYYSPMVEKAIIETLQLPTPRRTPRLTDEQVDMILGGNMARLLEI